ncbi:hypothetical protein HMPREF1162_0191 [ [[Propionibacterium] namnetense SK182B-JCVI]|uniref:Uncharacterized protein n=1 Tax=[Propionibacterium] namnetense SK182B-JCVI TaxID=1051006 RepID=F9NT23_9ACTN|nr:hypothetical protein HMPREF1162_0191 [ [[Propionibacterium] namnetense SK182B-JCVI]
MCVSVGIEIISLRVMDDEDVGGLLWTESGLLRHLSADSRRVE